MEFVPPNPEQVASHLADHPPRNAPLWQRRIPLIVLGAMIVMVLIVPGPIGLVLPWLALIGLMGWVTYRTRTARRLERESMALRDLAMLRRFPDALRRAWRLLPKVAGQPMLHARTVTVLAHCLDQLQAYESAIAGYDFLAEHLPDEHPGTMHVKVQRAICSLYAEQLVDADDELRALRQPIESYPGTPLSAAYRYARLIQDVRTHHDRDAIEAADDLVDELRPLGVEAGYGHALLALCYHRIDPDTDAERLWWTNATALLPAETLLRRFPELEPLTIPNA